MMWRRAGPLPGTEWLAEASMTECSDDAAWFDTCMSTVWPDHDEQDVPLPR